MSKVEKVIQKKPMLHWQFHDNLHIHMNMYKWEKCYESSKHDLYKQLDSTNEDIWHASVQENSKQKTLNTSNTDTYICSVLTLFCIYVWDILIYA